MADDAQDGLGEMSSTYEMKQATWFRRASVLWGVLIPTLEEFKALQAGAAPEVQTELVDLMTRDPETGQQHMVDIAAAQGVTHTTDEVGGFLL